MASTPGLLDALLERLSGPEDMVGPGGLFDQLKEVLPERALGAELTARLAAEARTPAAPRNRRNGTTPKTVRTDTSALPLAIPRDRAGTFEPQLVKKHQGAAPNPPSVMELPGGMRLYLWW